MAALQEARARREERKKAAAARAASVAHLLEVEEESIRAELDAWVREMHVTTRVNVVESLGRDDPESGLLLTFVRLFFFQLFRWRA